MKVSYAEKISCVIPQLPECVGRARIVVADERYRERNSLHTILQEAGCRSLLIAKSEEKILDFFRAAHRDSSQQVDLLVLSATFPGVDVPQLCRQISASEFCVIPIIVLATLSAATTSTEIDQFKDAGALDVLHPSLRDVEVIPRISLAIQYSLQVRESTRTEQELRDKLAQQRQITMRRDHALNYDRLTQLASRQYFAAELKRFLGTSRNPCRAGTFLYLDINNFKITNDIWGHEKGNQVLQEVAATLVRNLDEKHLIARLGSDEFAILLKDGDCTQALTVARDITKAVEKIVVGENNTQIATTICVGIFEIHPAMAAISVNEVFTRAHQACRIARSRGGDHIYLYDDKDTELQHMRQVVQSVSVVRRGLRENWFRLFLQPIFRSVDRKLSHFEVLLRLMDDQGNSYSPGLFIPAVEQAGLIAQVDYWVVEHSFDLLEKLFMINDDIGISINLSAVGMQEEDIYHLIEDRLSRTLIDPQRVTFELTETAAIKDVKKIRDTMNRLRRLGCRFALDDFGSGYCSFNYVKNFPVDYLKIDGLFIRNIMKDRLDQITVQAMVKIAHSLDKKVIAEFVESEEVIDCLKDMKVDYLQGYCLGKPEPAEWVLQQLEGGLQPSAGWPVALHSI